MRVFTDRFILTPGPTEVPLRVRRALLRETTNPDLDPSFMEFYEGLRGKLRKLLGAERSSLYVMVGEAMLGLDAAIANTVKRGTKVLVVSNGVFGEGFADLVRMHGGEPVVLDLDWRRRADPGEVERALERNGDAEVVTLVHCDTPSAVLNDLREVARVVKGFGKLLIVDAVSSVGGVEVRVDEWGVDLLIGGSQKALNVPAGLTVVTVSEEAWERIERVGYQGFYLNLRLWRDMLDAKGVFPYTPCDVLMYALDESLSMMLEEGLENVYKRHLAAREASWAAAEALGLQPYPASLEDMSPTVTAIQVPPGVDERELRRRAWEEYGVMLAGSWGKLEGKVVRVGHMGVQASINHLLLAYTALARALKAQGFKADAHEAAKAIEEAYSQAL